MSKQSDAQPNTAAAVVRVEGASTVPNNNFPFQLHRFITETADVAGWTQQGDQFFIDRRDPELLSRLMVPYFRRKSLKCGSTSYMVRIFFILSICGPLFVSKLYNFFLWQMETTMHSFVK